MVVFTCNHCGESLQKPKVEKHYQTQCRRNEKNLTCVDCFKDFREEEYTVHTKCITEDQRYAAKGSMPNGVIKKGEQKQELWTQMIHMIIEKETNVTVEVRNLLNILSRYTNVPRNRKKFMNFAANVFGRKYQNSQHLNQVWDLIEKYKNEQMKENVPNEATKRKNEEAVEAPLKKKSKKSENECEVTNGHSAENGNETEPAKKKKKGATDELEHETPTKKKSKKSVSNENEDLNNHSLNNQPEQPLHEDSNIEDKFSFEDAIIKILTKKKQLSITKVQNKVLKAYLKHRELDAYTDKHVKKFNKRLNGMKQVEIRDDTVILL